MSRQGAWAGSLLAALGGWAWASPALALGLQGVQHEPGKGLLVFHGDGQLPSPVVQSLSRPPRLVIDLPGVKALKPGAWPGVANTPIRRIRVGQYMANTARVVLDLEAPVSFPVVSAGPDLVLSLSGGTAPARPNSPEEPAPRPSSEAGGSGRLRALFWHRGALVASFDRSLPPPTLQWLPGQPPLWAFHFPGAGLGPGLGEQARLAQVPGLSRYRAVREGRGLRVELALAPGIKPLATPSGSAYRFTWSAPATSPRAQGSTPGPRPPLAPPPVLPSPRPTATPWPSPEPGQAPTIGLRKVGEGWELSVAAAGLTAARAQGLGQDRVHLDLQGRRLSFPRDSVYIDNGLIARVRAQAKGPGHMRLVLDFDQAVRFRLQGPGAQGRAVLQLARSGAPRVTLDPGHGGTDHGTVGQGGTREKDITLAIAQRLARLMESDGVAVQMTRMRDLEILLRPRVELANRGASDVFVSIHANSFPGNRQVAGVETYYFNDESYGLAQSIHRQLVGRLGRPDRGVRRNNFYVVHHTRMPAALVELGYLSNSQEEALLRDPAYQEKAAAAIHAGIQDFLAQRRRSH